MNKYKCKEQIRNKKEDNIIKKKRKETQERKNK